MSRPAPRPPLQQRVADAILQAAAEVFAAAGQDASMNDVAAAAGVARATLYRYFSNRDALVQELADVAMKQAGDRLASARIDEVPPDQAITRAVRALVDVGALFLVVARERVRPDAGQMEATLGVPLRRMIERAQQDGLVREDLHPGWLAETLVGLLVTTLSVRPDLDREDVVDTVTGLFLDGARARSSVEEVTRRRSA
jgi:AcrR family transcriptional regulator